MPHKAKAIIATSGSIFLIIIGYYLILSNQTILNNLNEGNKFIYASISTLIMILFGASMDLAWDLLDDLLDAERQR